jgi:S1-C subfamily serine protease
VRPGDVIVGFGDDPTPTVARYLERARRVLANDEVTLRLGRGSVKLRAVALDPGEIAARLGRKLGVEVADAGGRGALITRVARGSIADRIGIRPGDGILQLGQREVRSAADYAAALGELRMDQDTVMLLARGGYVYHITLSL